MNRMLTKKLTMAARALEFLRAHPFTDRSQAAMATQFAKLLDEAQALSLAEPNTRLAVAAARRHAAELRRGLEAHLLPGVARIGAFALRADTQAASRFAPLPGKSEAAFVARAASLLEAARAHPEVLARAGLSRNQVAELADGLTQFQAATALARELRQQHYDTKTALDRAMAELMAQLRLFDAYNRVRLQRDVALLERWMALRMVARGAARGKGEAPGVLVAAPGEGRPSAAA